MACVYLTTLVYIDFLFPLAPSHLHQSLDRVNHMCRMPLVEHSSIWRGPWFAGETGSLVLGFGFGREVFVHGTSVRRVWALQLGDREILENVMGNTSLQCQATQVSNWGGPPCC